MRITKGGLEAVIELSANLGAFYVGSTGQECVADRHKLASEAPDTLVIFCDSNDVERDEGFAILRVNDLLDARGRPLLKNSILGVIIHENPPKSGLVYVKCHPCVAPPDISFALSLKTAKRSISKDKERFSQFTQREDDFSSKKDEVVKALAKDLAECSLLSPTREQQNVKEYVKDVFSAAERSLTKSIDGVSPPIICEASKIKRLIEFKRSSRKKLKELLRDDADSPSLPEAAKYLKIDCFECFDGRPDLTWKDLRFP